MNTYLERQCEYANKAEGDLYKRDGYFCGRCKNKGLIFWIRGEELVTSRCSCLKTRKTIKILGDSGLSQVVERKTFDRFIDKEPWQKRMKERAQEFLENEEYKSFFIGGQSGCGKTHICTAICGRLIERAMTTAYFLWTRDARTLKSKASSEEYDQIIEQYREAKVLYIDDFLKVKRGAEPTPADINIAFELLNSRMLDSSKITIISSEFTLEELIAIDEATASRIKEAAGPFVQCIGRDPYKNQRIY